jgi:hypothetical protein
MRSKFRSSGSQVAFVPDWLSAEVNEALSRIGGDNVPKKEKTVLLLAQASAVGEPWVKIFGRKDTCSSKIWYGWIEKASGLRHPGWQDDVAIGQALEVATRRARWWMRVRQGRAVEAALDTIVEAAPDAAEQLVRMATRGAVRVRVGDEDAPVNTAVAAPEILRAINSLLDRADLKTASKARTELTGAGGGPIRVKDEAPDLTKLSDGDLAALRDLLSKAAPDEAAESG